ncbi:unnamed protein product [Urochloa humidicola]
MEGHSEDGGGQGGARADSGNGGREIRDCRRRGARLQQWLGRGWSWGGGDAMDAADSREMAGARRIGRWSSARAVSGQRKKNEREKRLAVWGGDKAGRAVAVHGQVVREDGEEQ